MGKKVRSARGAQVDFDLLRIKEQIASSPLPQDVKLRQDFIEKRLRRRLKKVEPPAPKIDTENKDKVQAPKLAETETLSETSKMIDEVKSEESKPSTKPRTRKPTPESKSNTKEDTDKE